MFHISLSFSSFWNRLFCLQNIDVFFSLTMEYIINTCCAKIGNRDYGTLRAILIIKYYRHNVNAIFSFWKRLYLMIALYCCVFLLIFKIKSCNDAWQTYLIYIYIQITHVSLVPYQIICKYMYALYDVSIFLKAQLIALIFSSFLFFSQVCTAIAHKEHNALNFILLL